ncbi:hypothetical protein ABID23_000639 [Bartonella silvatica]|uniref:Uncharacterized protein n=1 Tax=Bartonella silvatica TaxID=357760 RepID=A0ABV2HG80_9HYPH
MLSEHYDEIDFDNLYSLLSDSHKIPNIPIDPYFYTRDIRAKNWLYAMNREYDKPLEVLDSLLRELMDKEYYLKDEYVSK